MSPSKAPTRTRRARDVGLDVRAPKASCQDAHCPFHGHLSLRGQILEGTVVSTAMQRTAVVERTLLHFLPKFERFEKRNRRYLAHAPPCLGVVVGHRVRIAETRPLSKTVAFCVVEDLGEAAHRVKGEEAVEPKPTPVPEVTP
ncbi:MAG TPA: 30S ribosomal protein S17 [Thermoplasmata archaeon]|nr:30S ribosomal protein S17 [Thermoplasmata archaeon]